MQNDYRQINLVGEKKKTDLDKYKNKLNIWNEHRLPKIHWIVRDDLMISLIQLDFSFTTSPTGNRSVFVSDNDAFVECRKKISSKDSVTILESRLLVLELKAFNFDKLLRFQRHLIRWSSNFSEADRFCQDASVAKNTTVTEKQSRFEIWKGKKEIENSKWIWNLANAFKSPGRCTSCNKRAISVCL